MKNLIIVSSLFVLSFLPTVSNAQDSMLEAVGGMSAVSMYNTYLTIGLLADGFEVDAYTSEEIGIYMDEQISMMGNLAEQMQKLVDSGELKDPSDIDYCSKEISVFRGLQRQASYLKDYAMNGFEQSDADAFQGQRLQNWADISQLLGLENSGVED